MIVQKRKKFSDNREFIHTFSDLEGYGVMRDGIIYEEAYDPIELIEERIYTEVKLPEEEDEDGYIKS